MSYRTISTSVDIYMDEFDDDDLIEELQDRGFIVGSKNKSIENSDVIELIKTLYEKRRNSINYQQELDEIIYSVIGRI